jgi:hypothetical protein
MSFEEKRSEFLPTTSVLWNARAGQICGTSRGMNETGRTVVLGVTASRREVASGLNVACPRIALEM